MKMSLKTITGYYHRIGLNYEEITLTAAQTVVNVSYKKGYVNVFREGIQLKPTEYTATNGTTIILDVAAEDDEIIVIKREKFTW